MLFVAIATRLRLSPARLFAPGTVLEGQPR